MNDWDAWRKMSDWDVSLEMSERLLRRKNTWLTVNDEIIWWKAKLYDFDNFDDKELDNEFDHLIDDFIDLIVNDIRRW